ncbi:MAG: MerR family transcriptional regulator [Actinomycetia bacterium]|nr:MerR family transcriptional regulator [Actinomycetes bacterium]MDQ1654493.1 hypothetical protein [Cryptosporangiaceae bacterium]
MGAMDDGTFTIGDLARRTGLTVKTIRFYSDEGLVPPSGRSPAGYRSYDADGLARLEFVHTLRSLGIGLAAVRSVLTGDATLAEVLGEHASDLDARIRALRVHRAVVRSVLDRGAGVEEIAIMSKLAKLSDGERRRLVTEMLDEAMDGLDVDPDVAGYLRAAMPELPDDPSPGQAEAWVELGELVRDPGFRGAVRRLFERQAAERADGTAARVDTSKVAQDAIVARVTRAIASGEPAGPVLGEVVPLFLADGVADTPEIRRWLAERLELAADERGQRYWELLAAINGWAPIPNIAPVAAWLAEALESERAGALGSDSSTVG